MNVVEESQPRLPPKLSDVSKAPTQEASSGTQRMHPWTPAAGTRGGERAFARGPLLISQNRSSADSPLNESTGVPRSLYNTLVSATIQARVRVSTWP